MSESFKFEFLDTESGWIDFEISIYNQTFHYSFSDAISTQPEELIGWLEKIYNEEYCEFDCNTEDFHFYLNYDGKTLWLYDQMNPLGKEAENDQHKYLHATIEISRIELCRIIYKAFRDFVTSKKYKSVEWQSEVTFEETLIDSYGSLDNAIEVGASKRLQEFYEDYIEKSGFEKYSTGFELFQELEHSDYPSHPIESTFDSSDKYGRKKNDTEPCMRCFRQRRRWGKFERSKICTAGEKSRDSMNEFND